MVRMKDFGAAVHEPELGGIAEVGPWDRGRRVAECIGAVSHGLILEPEVFMLHMHIIDAERLAPVIQRAAAGAIRIRQRITLREEVALLVDRTERLIANLVIDQDELPEVRPLWRIDNRLPTAAHLSGVSLSEWIQIA